MTNVVKFFRKRSSSHKDYFFENEEKMFKYFEMTLMNQH
jgi:hypothetical protein